MVRLNTKYTQAIWEFTEALQQETQLESALTGCMELMKRAIGCEAGFVWMLNESTDRLSVIACAKETDETGVTIAKNQGLVGHAMETAEIITFQGEIGEDSPLYGSDQATGMKVVNQIVAPLKTPGGAPFGCIQLINKDGGGRFDEADVRLAGNLAALIALDIDDKGFEMPVLQDRTPIISLRNVTKNFRSGDETLHVLKGIDLDIYPKEFLVILGESGCGKTTLMNIIGGMDSMTDGQLEIDGKDFSHPTDSELTEYRRNFTGFIFQSYNLMPNLSALENLEFVAEICKEPLKPADTLQLVGLTDRAGNFPSQMSGGQQQRVSIARALTKNPRLILADEPTAALDYDTSIEILSIVEDIVRNQGKTVIMITHNPEIAKMADRVVRIRSGQISSIRINSHPLHAKELSW